MTNTDLAVSTNPGRPFLGMMNVTMARWFSGASDPAAESVLTNVDGRVLNTPGPPMTTSW